MANGNPSQILSVRTLVPIGTVIAVVILLWNLQAGIYNALAEASRAISTTNKSVAEQRVMLVGMQKQLERLEASDYQRAKTLESIQQRLTRVETRLESKD